MSRRPDVRIACRPVLRGVSACSSTPALSGTDYRKPLLLLFLSHASFLWMLPVHLAFLRLRSDEPLRPVLRTLAQVARRQVDALPFGRPDAPDKAWPWERGSLAILLLTLGVTAPAALFYLCVPLTECFLTFPSCALLVVRQRMLKRRR